MTLHSFITYHTGFECGRFRVQSSHGQRHTKDDIKIGVCVLRSLVTNQ